MARNVWSDRPLGVKLTALVAAGGLSLGVLAVVAVEEFHGAEKRTDVLLDTTHATAEALEADMMHDAVRGDVLQALLENSGPLYESAVADLGEHSGRFRELLEGILADDLGADVNRAVEEVSPVVEEYLASADGMVTLAGTSGPAAEKSYPEFLEAFSALEDALPVVSDAISSHAVAAA